MGHAKRSKASTSAAPPAAVETRLFSVQEANAALPLVRAIVSDLVELARDVTERRQRLLSLARLGNRQDTDPYEEELVQMEKDLEKDSQRVVEYVEELRQLGIATKSVTEGLVDFPAMIGGRAAYLCWQLGEPEVSYWHELDAGFRGRQPLASLEPDRPESGKKSLG